MKINKRSPRHWTLLVRQAGFSILAIVMRPMRRLLGSNAERQPVILLYGHQFNGNLAAIYREWERTHQETLSLHFLALDPDYANELQQRNICALSCSNLPDMKWLWRADVIITDHGLHSMGVLKKMTDIKFVDVWHGIPFKGYDDNDMAMLKDYTAIWTTSEQIKQLYCQKMKLPAEKIQVTGYARTDKVYAPSANLVGEIKTTLKLDRDKTHILYAPTWENTQSNYAYTEQTIENLCLFSDTHDTVVIYRPHLNSRQNFSHAKIKTIPASQYPDIEDLLLVADILVTDWSSIAFDFLLRKKPTLFMDKPAPFKSFTVDPEHRFGEIVQSPDHLPEVLERITLDPSYFLSTHGEKMEKTCQFVYQTSSLGNSANRCLEEAIKLTT